MWLLNKKLHARLFMAFHLLSHGLSRLDPTVRRRRGMERFRASFFPEALTPATPLARLTLPQADRCITCDLCLAVDTGRDRLSARDLALRVARGSNDWDVARELLASDDAYARAEDLCPERIPFRKLAAVVRGAPSIQGSGSIP